MKEPKVEIEPSVKVSNLKSVPERKVEGRVRVYISSSINSQSTTANESVAKILRASGLFQVYLPQESIPPVHHDELERWAPRYCERYIDLADFVLLLMDTYGIDCSWEVGYAHKFKPIVAFVRNQRSYEFHKQDWMVKYAIDCIITPNKKISELAKKDKMLRDVPIHWIRRLEDLPLCASQFYYRLVSTVGQELMVLKL